MKKSVIIFALLCAMALNKSETLVSSICNNHIHSIRCYENNCVFNCQIIPINQKGPEIGQD